MTPEQIHTRLKHLPKEVRMFPQKKSESQRSPKQREVIQQTVVQGQPITNIQAPPGTGKTATNANMIAFKSQAHPEWRMIVVTPTNLAGEKLAQECVEALHRFAVSKTRDNILLF